MQTNKQTNKRRGATTALHGGEDTRQEMIRVKRRERGRGKWCGRRKANTGSKQKINVVAKTNNSSDIDPNEPVNIVALTCFSTDVSDTCIGHAQ